MALQPTRYRPGESPLEIGLSSVMGGEELTTKTGKPSKPSDGTSELSSSHISFIRCLDCVTNKAEKECRRDVDTHAFAPIFSLHTLFTSKVKGLDIKTESPEKMEGLINKLASSVTNQGEMGEIFQVVLTLIRHSPLKNNNFHWPSSYHFEPISPNRGTITFKIDLLEYHQKKSIQLILLNDKPIYPTEVHDDKVTFQVVVPSTKPAHFSGTLNVPIDAEGDSLATDTVSKTLSYKFICPVLSTIVPEKNDHKKP